MVVVLPSIVVILSVTVEVSPELSVVVVVHSVSIKPDIVVVQTAVEDGVVDGV